MYGVIKCSLVDEFLIIRRIKSSNRTCWVEWGCFSHHSLYV